MPAGDVRGDALAAAAGDDDVACFHSLSTLCAAQSKKSLHHIDELE
jgi:hypothetical protein